MSTGNVAELIVRQFAAHDVSYIFLNPGTDTAPVQEAVLRLGAAGERVPTIVLCPHEGVALSAAHAYFAVSGKPQVVMVHVDVGTQNLGGAVHNAARAQVAVVILAGRTPITANGELPGGRDSVVHWMQDVADQAGVVRPYVKHAHDIGEASTAARDVARAFQVARSSPPGPVYLTAGRELLMTAVPAGGATLDVQRFGEPSLPAPDPEAIADAASVLAHAHRPVIVTTRVGQHPAAVATLVAVADLLGALVIDSRERMNFPSDHPSYVKDVATAQRALSEADAVLVVDSPVPWVPAVAAPAPDATVISLDADPVRTGMSGWLFPVDINIHTDPTLGLRALETALEARFVELGRPPAARATAPARVAAPSGGVLDSAAVGTALEAVIGADDIIVEEATTNFEGLRSTIERTLPGTYFRSGGSSLGWGVGAALGAKLARPDRRVISLVGDGAFIFASPIAALWAMRLAGAPSLVIVLANGGYAASRAPVFRLFPDGESARTGEVLGTLFADAPDCDGPDLAMVAEACGAYGAHVRDADELERELEIAIAHVDAGRSALIVAHVTSPFIRRPT